MSEASDKKNILTIYDTLKDDLQTWDDFYAMSRLIEKMGKLDASKAFEMWYSLLNPYKAHVIGDPGYKNAALCLVGDTLVQLGEDIGHEKLDEIILADKELFHLLFAEYRFAGSYHDYTQSMLFRALFQRQYTLADRMFETLCGNDNRGHSWFETMDNFLFQMKNESYSPKGKAKAIIEKWAAKVVGKKDRAKLMAQMLASNTNFDLSLFQNDLEPTINKNSQVLEDKIETEPLLAVAKNHIDAFSERARLKALLSDCYPQKVLFVNAILMAFDEGFVAEFLSTSTIDGITTFRMQTTLVNNYGISKELAESTISTLKEAFNK